MRTIDRSSNLLEADGTSPRGRPTFEQAAAATTNLPPMGIRKRFGLGCKSRRGFLFVIVSAIVGAAFFDGLLMASNIAYTNWGHDHWLVGLGWLLIIPAMMISRDANPWVIDALLGAFTFSLVAVFVKSALKGENKEA